jgi:hypothetical protein
MARPWLVTRPLLAAALASWNRVEKLPLEMRMSWAIDAAIRRYLRDQWQPIESAPTVDMAPVEVWVDGGLAIARWAVWPDGTGCWLIDRYECPPTPDPTHWKKPTEGPA